MTVRFTLNGIPATADPAAVTALAAIRGQGLTGTKPVCGSGVCGACVIRVDDVPVASCLLPVEDLVGTEVVTVEGVGGVEPHPVQRAMAAADGLQCGFCTPGFVVEAATFHDRWREKHGQRRPDRVEVDRALAGHLCRCGAYPGIVAAVQDACEGRFDAGPVVGPRVEAAGKVSGAVQYTLDLTLPGMLHGRIVRSPLAHARLVDIDTGPAMAIPGVEAVLTFPPPDGRLRFVGEGFAAVAARTPHLARQAADAVVAIYEELPPVVGIDAAMDERAPNLHGRGWTPPNSSEFTPLPNLRRGNVRGPLSIGSVRRFRARRPTSSQLTIDQEWRFAAQVHTAFEPHVCIADWGEGHLTVFVSTQAVSAIREKIADRVGLDPEAVTVHAEHVGGAFGAKQGLNEETVVAIELSKAAGRPVRVAFGRREEMEVAGYRPGARVRLALHGDADGRAPSFDVTSHADGGASAGQIIATLLRFAYPGSPRALVDYDVLTNAPPGRAMRAPGGPLAFTAVEGAVDEYARRLDMDPIRLRRRWGGEGAQGRLYDWVAHHDLWRDRPSGDSGRFRRGVGSAFGYWAYFFDPDTEVQVSSGPDGFEVTTGTQDMGQGSRTVLARAVAQTLGVDPGSVRARIGRSGVWGPTSAGSRTATSIHPAAAIAARELAGRLAVQARDRLGLDDAQPTHGGLSHAGEFLPWADLLGDLEPETASAGRPPDTRRPLTPFSIEAIRLGWGIARAAHLVEVEVDTRLGRVRALHSANAFAIGEVHVPELARSQVHGGVVQGLGYALFEERLLDPKTGLNITADFDSYRLPGIADIPSIDAEFLPGDFGHSASRSAGLAELATAAVPAAVANAVSAATGRRFTDLPIRPDRVLELLS